MIEGLRVTLSFIDKLGWILLSVSGVLVLADPDLPRSSVLGFDVSHERLYSTVAAILIVLYLARQIYIQNAIYIVSHAGKRRRECLETLKAYPLLELLRWKERSAFAGILLTIFQVAFDVFPAVSLVLVRWRLGLPWPVSAKVLPSAAIVLSLLNYNTLRDGLYRRFVGKIETPD